MEESRRRGRPRKQEVKAVETVSDLPIEVTNCIHGRSCELIKVIQEIKGKIEPLEKELECAEKELQTLLEFISAHESEILKLGTKVKIIKSYDANALPIGTYGEITTVDPERDVYRISANDDVVDDSWWYARDMFVVVEDGE